MRIENWELNTSELDGGADVVIVDFIYNSVDESDLQVESAPRTGEFPSQVEYRPISGFHV